MAKHDTYKSLFGLAQVDMATILMVSRTHWAHHERQHKNLPPEAGMLLNEMVLHMHSEEAKLTENQPVLKEAKEKTKQALGKLWKENEYQLTLLNRKIEKAKQKKDKHVKAAEITNFLIKRAEVKNGSVSKGVASIASIAEINLKSSLFTLNMLEAQQQLLMLQQDWLKKNISYDS
jgi:hypothetical protein